MYVWQSTRSCVDTLTRGGGGGKGGNPRTVRVTLTYADTLTRGGGKGGNPRTVRVLSELLWISEWTTDKTRHHWTSHLYITYLL